MATRTWKDGDLTRAVERAQSLQETIVELGLRPKGGNAVSITKHIERLGLSTEHFAKKRHPAFSYEETFCENSPCLNVTRQVMRLKLLPYKCVLCKNKGTHRNRPLKLQIDHKNGVGNDNRVRNLRFLCPNCHSQTETYCGRNRKRDLESSNGRTGGFGPSNGGPNPSSRTRKPHKTKISWPDPSKLQEMIESKPITSIAKALGVSDNAVRKQCKKLSIAMKGRGFWSKK